MKHTRTRARRRDPDPRVEQWKPRGRFSGATYIDTKKIEKAIYDAGSLLPLADRAMKKIVRMVESPTATAVTREYTESEIKYLKGALEQALYYVDLASKEIRR